MFVVSKRNIILPGPNGEKFHMPKDYIGPVPAWAESSAYLEALAEDGKVVISDSGRDNDIDKAEKNGKRKRRKKDLNASKEDEPTEEIQEPPEASGEEDG